MNFRAFAESKGFFEISHHIAHPCVRERIFYIKTFFEVLATLPVALGYKLYKSFFRGAGVLLSTVLLLATLGLSKGLRELFVKRVSVFAADVADWVLYPFALFTCFFRLLLASLVHPSLFFRY